MGGKQSNNLTSIDFKIDWQLPVQCQGQYDAVIGSIEALRLLLFKKLNMEKADQEQDALILALEIVSKVTALSIQLQDVPEAASSAIAERMFKTEPLIEGSTYDKLLEEMREINSLRELQEWYDVTSPQRELITSLPLRNSLFDMIRKKRTSLR